MFNQIGGLNAIGAPLSPNQIGGESFIRHIGNDKLIFDFHEGSGTKVYDKSHCGNNGTFAAGAAAPTWQRNSLYFDGGDFIDLGSTHTLAVAKSTFLVQIKPTVLSGYHIIYLLDSTPKFYINVSSYKSLFYNAQNNPEGDTAFVANVSEHRGITHDGANTKFYLNGCPDGIIANTVAVSTTASQGNIGGDTGGTQNLIGIMYSFRVLDYALSQIEIQQEYLANKFRGNN